MRRVTEVLTPSKPPLISRTPLSVEKQVAVVLFYLASCCEYRVVGNLFGIHKSTVWKCMHAVVAAINAVLMPKWITMPNEIECRTISTEYEKLAKIPQIIGAIDGTHIPILAPSEGYRDFVNRKGWPSYVLQGVVDSTLRFRNINCQAPGCSHDSAVLRESQLYQNAETAIPSVSKEINGVHVPYFLIGDSAYPLLPWLMKAYTNTELTAEQEIFGTCLNRGRVHIEMALGRLKSRWRTLLKHCELDYRFVQDVVAACCTLHNILETKKDPVLSTWQQSVRENENVFPQPENLVRRRADNFNAIEIREVLCNYLVSRLAN